VNEFRWTDAEVRSALGLEPDAGAAAEYEQVLTDTRALGMGSLFVALAGERFDAHDFLGQAAEAGATGAVVARIPADAPAGLRYYVVPDTLRAFGLLARHRRRRLSARVVGVVGSNGKTTTKDLLRAALGTRYRVHATQGNFNNQVGVPITLLAAPDDAEMLVLEMGTNEPGEIEVLSRIAEPDAAIVTAIAEEHLEKLGDLDGVLREETAVLPALPASGIGIVAEEPASLPARAREMLGEARVRVAGFAETADLRPDGGRPGVELTQDGTTRWSWRGHTVHLPLRGVHNVRNALLALGLAEEWGVAPADALRGLESMPAPKLRGEWHSIGGVRVIADCYNSNPYGLEAAVDLLASLPAEGEKIVVVGTMRELGDRADALHRGSAESLHGRLGQGVDRVVATGAFVDAFRGLDAGPRLVSETDPIAAFESVAPSLRGDETILLKASRGETLERWLPLLEQRFGAGSA
jgi:UDP-N-acetylmuramoyl-tripeptide--D-alanyl-D-alanine ligase